MASMLLRCAALLALLAGVSPAGASPEAVHVIVRDAAGHPVVAAIVYAKTKGTDLCLGTTGADGSVVVDAAPGTPIFARWKGGESRTEIVRGVTVDLAPGLTTIDTVEARLPLGSLQTSVNSASAIIAGNVTNALGFVPNYRTQDEGGSGSLELNGTPLTLPAGGGTRFSVPSDLIESFTPDQADDGSITPDFHLQNPTGSPEQAFSIRDGSQDTRALKGTFTGPGYAFVVSDELSEGLLSGQVFSDQSGDAYDHSANQHQLAGSSDVEFRVGRARVSAVALGSYQRNAQVSVVEPGSIPEGYGPGNFQRTQMLDGYIRASETLGRDDWTALHVEYAGSATDNDMNAVAQGVAIPSLTGFGYAGRYDLLNFTRRFGQDSATIAVSNTMTTADSFAQPFESVSNSSGTDATLSLNRSARASSVTAAVTATRETGPFTAAHVNASLLGSEWSNNSRLRWSLFSAQSQIVETYYAQALRLAVPGAANYDCASHAAFASGASDVTPDAPHTSGVTGTLTERIDARNSLTAGGFFDATSNALVVAAQSGGAVLPAGYLQQLSAQYSYLCGGSGALLPSQLYLIHYVTVPERIDKEWYLASKSSIGRFDLALGYETYSAVAFGVGALPAGSNSTLINGMQIWNVPLHRASAILSIGSRAATAGIGVAYVSANNAAHLPAYAIVSTGVRLAAGSGDFLLSVQNLFHQDAGYFTSPAFAAQSAMTGASLGFLAVPVAPTWSFTYELRTGRGTTH